MKKTASAKKTLTALFAAVLMASASATVTVTPTGDTTVLYRGTSIIERDLTPENCASRIPVDAETRKLDANYRCVNTKSYGADYEPTPAPTPAPAPAPVPAPPPPAPAPAPEADPLPIVRGCPTTTIMAGTVLLPRGALCERNVFFAGDAPKLIKTEPGVGPVAEIRVSTGNGIEAGTYSLPNPANLRIEDLKITGASTQDEFNRMHWGIFVRGNHQNIKIRRVEISRFQIAINAQSSSANAGMEVTDSNIHHNSGMGILGNANGLKLLRNNFSDNNYITGSTFNHAIYLGSSSHVTRNVTIADNTLTNNSAPNGTCVGGNLTLHGQFDGVLVENNRITQRASGGGCWGVSITPAYGSAESFLNVVVRGNTIERLGLPIGWGSAPGIVVENNVSKGSWFPEAAVSGAIAPEAGDATDANATVRNNVSCGHANGSLAYVRQAPAVTTVSGNTVTATCQ